MDLGDYKTLDELIHDADTAGTYVGDDGLLYCNKCRKQKQVRVTLFGVERVSTCTCACDVAIQEQINKISQKQNEQDRRDELRSMGIEDLAWGKYTFDADDKRDPKASDVCRRYADNFGQMLKDGTGLILFGALGCGKTFLAGCIANALIDANRSVLMSTLPKLIDSMVENYAENRGYVIDKLAKFALVVLDDYGVERSSEFSLQNTYTVINERYRSGKPLIVTTNKTMTELKDEPNLDRARINDRLMEMCLPVIVKGGSRRKGIGKEKLSRASEILGL